MQVHSDDEVLLEACLHFLDQTHQLGTLKKECLTYSNNTEITVYNFDLQVHFTDISEISATLGNVVLHQPQRARKLFQEVCFTSLKSLGLLPSDVSCSQILVNLHMVDLPHLTCYRLTSAELLAGKFEARFYRFVGTVCSISSPIKYSRCAKYRCRDKDCLGAVDNFYIRCHIEGATEKQTVRKDFICIYCGAILCEDVNCRVLGERVTVQMVEGDTLQLGCQDVAKYNQTIPVVLRDDFLNIQLGGNYCVIGIPVKEFAKNGAVSVAIEANSVRKISAKIPKQLTSSPQSVTQLLAESVASPWTFSASLAYLFAGDVAPPGTYHRLKLCMLLSLIDAASGPSSSEKQESKCFLDLVAIGTDSHIIRRLMMYGSSFAPRSVVHGSGQLLFASLDRDPPTASANYTITAGSVLLAHGGICLLGDVDSLRKDTREKMLHQVLDRRTVHVDLPMTSGSASRQQSFPLECNLWGSAECYITNDTGKDTLFSTPVIKKTANQSLLECFSLVLSCDYSNPSYDDPAELSIVKQTLLCAMQSQRQLDSKKTVISPDDIKWFLGLASEMSVEFSAPARKLLKGYFVGSRRVRSTRINGVSFPAQALQTLACMSRAHAKLNLHDEITKEDAAFAVLLYEEAITARCGFSVLNVQPRPHYKDNYMDDFIGSQNDAFMKDFLAQLSLFCHSHSPDFNLHEPED